MRLLYSSCSKSLITFLTCSLYASKSLTRSFSLSLYPMTRYTISSSGSRVCFEFLVESDDAFSTSGVSLNLLLRATVRNGQLA